MCVYNGEKYLREAVDSILSQTFTDFEFVIVNDGSKDATGEILASYRDPRLKICTIENMGLPVALNYGLERCSSDLVMRMDADDIAYPHRFAALLEDWEQAGRPDVFGSGADYINEDGIDLWSVNMPLDDATIRMEIYEPDGKMTIMHPTVLMRKEAVLACGAYDPYFKNGQDYDLWLRMTAHYRFGNSPRRLLRYRFQQSSDTARAVRVVNGKVNFGNWMRLISLQKKLMIDAGEEQLWKAHSHQIIGELQKRTDMSSLQSESTTLRFLTEAKIHYRTGKKVKGIRKFFGLFFLNPGVVINRLLGGKMTNISLYLLSAAEVKQHLSQTTKDAGGDFASRAS